MGNGNLRIKVCGMRETQNIIDVSFLKPDFMGFIFYSKSPRNAANIQDPYILKKLNNRISKTGVFVNSDINTLNYICKKYFIDFVQLHGDENPEFCKHIYKRRKIIKAFAVDENFDFNICKDYEEYCYYFLFDTKGKKFGGNSIKFNWKVLKKYQGKTPFLLSGGIGPDDITELKIINHDMLAGIDINSRFEIKPGLKDVRLVENFIAEFKK